MKWFVVSETKRKSKPFNSFKSAERYYKKNCRREKLHIESLKERVRE